MTDTPIPDDVINVSFPIAVSLAGNVTDKVEASLVQLAAEHQIARAILADREAQAKRVAVAKIYGAVPVLECPFTIGQPVYLANPYPGDDPYTVYYVTGILWEYRFVAHYGWNITVATQDEIQNGHGATDGFAPSDLRPARALLAKEGSDAV